MLFMPYMLMLTTFGYEYLYIYYLTLICFFLLTIHPNRQPVIAYRGKPIAAPEAPVARVSPAPREGFMLSL